MVVYTAKFHGKDRIIIANDDVAMVLGADDDCAIEVAANGEIVWAHGDLFVGAVRYTDVRQLQ